MDCPEIEEATSDEQSRFGAALFLSFVAWLCLLFAGPSLAGLGVLPALDGMYLMVAVIALTLQAAAAAFLLCAIADTKLSGFAVFGLTCLVLGVGLGIPEGGVQFPAWYEWVALLSKAVAVLWSLGCVFVFGRAFTRACRLVFRPVRNS